MSVRLFAVLSLLVALLSPGRATAEPLELAAAPLAAELTVSAELPFAPLTTIARLPDVLVVLDTTRAPLRRGRVDLLRGTAGVFGARVRGVPSVAATKLLRRLQPALLILEVGPTDALEAVVAAAQSVGAGTSRVELAAPPTAGELSILRRLRPCTLRLSLSSATPQEALLRLHSFPGRVELAVEEDASAQWLSALAWPSQAALVLAPRDGNYLVDANLASLATAARLRHVVKVTLPLRRVEAEQIRRLPGASLELVIDGVPTREGLRTLLFTQGHGSWPSAADGGPLPPTQAAPPSDGGAAPAPAPVTPGAS